MYDARDRRIAEIAARQHSVFTLAQVNAVGFTPDQRKLRLATGRWEGPHPGVYRIAGVADSWRGRLLAACWSAHGLAFASHRSSAQLWGLPGGRTDLVEITCHRARRAKAAGIVIHESKLLCPEDIRTVDGIPTTSVEQTLLGLAAVVRSPTVEIALDRALHLGLTSSRRLEQFVELKGAQGRNGVGVLRDLLRMHDPLAGLSESAMETKLKQLLRRHGLPNPTFQYEIWHDGRFIARVDAAYPDHRLAIEFDSYEHHTGRLAIVRDNDRRNVLKRIEWQPITFTAADISRDGGEALETLRSALRSGATHRQ